MTTPAASERPALGRRHSVFWKVAGILVGVQVTTGLLAVALTAFFAADRSRDLAANSLRLRLDDLAQEVEQRADTSLAAGLAALPVPLRFDLARRFPDPVILLDADGGSLDRLAPDPDAFLVEAAAPETAPPLPEGLGGLLANGDLVVEIDPDAAAGTWGLAPVYDRDGFLAGGLLVQPLTFSMARELEGTQQAYRRAVVVAGGLAGLIALVLGAFFTLRLIRPLRRMTRQVERIGAGEYAARVAATGNDEFGRLGGTINRMAEAVAHSVETLRATDRLRRELIANVGHDLRTPLAALTGYLEEGQRFLDAGQHAEAVAALATAERQADYLRRLIDDLFELSLLDSGPRPLRREPIPLAELLTEAALAHRAAFEKAGIRFRLDLPETLPIYEGDGVRLLRLLDNLLANARHHTPEGGTVTLRAAASDAAVTLVVEDTGPGMPPEVLAHVFERYYRGEEARTRRSAGTGLGLAISRAIARAHGGDLAAESTPGRGSIFSVTLPLEGKGDLGERAPIAED